MLIHADKMGTVGSLTFNLLIEITYYLTKGLWMPQGSILPFQNLNFGPGSKLAKNSKFLHVAWKSVIGLRILQGLILYAQNCPKLSGDPLKPCLLKNNNPCMHTSLSLKIYGNQVDCVSELSNHILIMYLPHVWTNLLLNICAKTLGKSQHAIQSAAC
jgi:hypothetical protein